MTISTNLEEAIAKLRTEEAALAKTAAELKAQEKLASRDLRRIRSSIAQLSGDSASAKPTLTEAQALAFLATALRKGPRNREALQKALLEHAKSTGCSGTGIHLMLARLLKSHDFEETNLGVALRANA